MRDLKNWGKRKRKGAQNTPAVLLCFEPGEVEDSSFSGLFSQPFPIYPQTDSCLPIPKPGPRTTICLDPPYPSYLIARPVEVLLSQSKGLQIRFPLPFKMPHTLLIMSQLCIIKRKKLSLACQPAISLKIGRRQGESWLQASFALPIPFLAILPLAGIQIYPIKDEQDSKISDLSRRKLTKEGGEEERPGICSPRRSLAPF